MLTLQSFGNLWTLISNSGLVAQAVLIILLLFSIMSWAITYKKYRLFLAAKRENRNFYAHFTSTSSLSAIQNECDNFPTSPLSAVFKSAYVALEREIEVLNGGNTGVHNWKGIQRSLHRATQVEMRALEESLNWLATTAAVTPFIGLFGTVIGIINAFQGLGAGSTTTIQAVAPGISEALVATAAGLFAAIPALIAYNHFLGDLKIFGTEMDDFTTELLTLLERSFGSNR